MNYNIVLIAWLFIAYVIIQNGNAYRIETVMGTEQRRIRPEYAVMVILPIIILAGMRSFQYADTPAYIDAFNSMPDTLRGIPSYMETVTKDEGFSLFSCLIRAVVSTNPRVYLFIIAGIQGLIVAFLFRKYSEDYILSIFLFVASTDYMAWMYNGMRQFLAVMIIYAATEYILEKKYVKAILVILLASSIHGSALLMIPIVFILQGKAWNYKTVLIIIGCVWILQYVEQFTDILDTLLVDTQYKSVVSDWELWEDDGTNIIRVLVYSIPAILSFIGMKRIKAADNKVINMVTNASVITTVIYLVSSVTSGIFIGRLPIYVSLYGYILLPWAINHFFTKDSQKIVTMTMVVFYLLFYAYSIMNGMGAGAW